MTNWISFVGNILLSLTLILLFRIMAKYSEKFNAGKNKVGLIYKGKAVIDTDTPISIGFKDGDIVCVYKK